MILLDPNVISEPLRKKPDSRVVAWLDSQPVETLYLSTVTVAELRAGVNLLPQGKRRNRLQSHIETSVIPLFSSRILDFDLACTEQYAQILSHARTAGVGISAADAFIAAVAATHDLVVASRDTAPFAAVGVRLVNPWLD